MDVLTLIAIVVGIVTGPISAVAAVVFLYDRFGNTQTQLPFYRTLRRLPKSFAVSAFTLFGGALAVLGITLVQSSIMLPQDRATDSATLSATFASYSPSPQATSTPSPTPKPDPTTTPAPERTTTPVPTPKLAVIKYSVQLGDTLQGIAQRFEVPMEKIVEFNDIAPDTLFAGQLLRILIDAAQLPLG